MVSRRLKLGYKTSTVAAEIVINVKQVGIYVGVGCVFRHAGCPMRYS